MSKRLSLIVAALAAVLLGLALSAGSAFALYKYTVTNDSDPTLSFEVASGDTPYLYWTEADGAWIGHISGNPSSLYLINGQLYIKSSDVSTAYYHGSTPEDYNSDGTSFTLTEDNACDYGLTAQRYNESLFYRPTNGIFIVNRNYTDRILNGPMASSSNYIMKLYSEIYVVSGWTAKTQLYQDLWYEVSNPDTSEGFFIGFVVNPGSSNIYKAMHGNSGSPSYNGEIVWTDASGEILGYCSDATRQLYWYDRKLWFQANPSVYGFTATGTSSINSTNYSTFGLEYKAVEGGQLYSPSNGYIAFLGGAPNMTTNRIFQGYSDSQYIMNGNSIGSNDTPYPPILVSPWTYSFTVSPWMLDPVSTTLPITEQFIDAGDDTMSNTTPFTTTISFTPQKLQDGIGIYAGPDNAFASVSMTSEELSAACPNPATTNALVPDISAFSEPGRYTWIASRTTTAQNSEWSWSDEKYLVSVVVSRALDDELEITEAVINNLTQDDNGTYIVGSKAEELQWSHTSRQNRALTIGKEVLGDYGRRDYAFGFTVAVELPDWYEAGTVSYSGTHDHGQVVAADATIPVTTDETTGEKTATLSVNLAHGDVVTLNVPPRTEYTVTEATDTTTGKAVDATGLSYDTAITYGADEPVSIVEGSPARFYNTTSWTNVGTSNAELYLTVQPDEDGYITIPATPNNEVGWRCDESERRYYPGEKIRAIDTHVFIPMSSYAPSSSVYNVQTQAGESLSCQLSANGLPLYAIPAYQAEAGYKFIGWATSSSPGSSYDIYMPGELRTLSSSSSSSGQLSSSNLTLYPIVAQDTDYASITLTGTVNTSTMLPVGSVYTLPESTGSYQLMTSSMWGHSNTGYGYLLPGDKIYITQATSLSLSSRS